MYGLSLGAMTFDLGPRSLCQNAIFANILKTTRDGDFISIIDIYRKPPQTSYRKLVKKDGKADDDRKP